MTTNHEIIITKEQDVIVIPRSALIIEDGKQFVYVREFGKTTLREVTGGKQSEKQVVIKSGLKEGEKILLTKPESKKI